MTGFLFGGGGANPVEVFNVKTYGAVADSNANASTGTDSTAAIQAAIDAATAVGGGTIYFPPGNGFAYKVTAPLTFMGNLCVYYFLGGGTAALSNAVVGGSDIVGNFAGYIFDRNQINSSGAVVHFSHLGVRNSHSSGSGIRLIGVDAGCGVSHCEIQAGLFGIQLGGVGSPASASFTANSSGTTLTVSGITGTIDSNTFPCPIQGTGVPAATNITAFGTATGGNGTYITNQATTCSGSTVTTHPNAPSSFCVEVNNCKLNGLGTYNVVPASSYFGVGIQMSPETIVRSCHINTFGVAVRGYGQGNWIYGCQMESNTTGIQLGIDGGGNNSATTGGVISGCSMESNVTGIHLWAANYICMDGTVITGAVDGSHNSTYGVLVDSAQFLSMRGVACSGTFATGGFYLGGGSGAIRMVRAECCSGAMSKHSSVNYSCITAVHCSGFPTLSSTLAQLNTTITAGDVNAGERRLVSDANTALGSQVYNAAVTGGSSNLASVWYDGTTVRYG